MNLTDTHCHLADPELRENLPDILTAARGAGVGRFIVPATWPQDWQDVADLAKRSSENPLWGNIHIALGIHPWFSGDVSEPDFQLLEQALQALPAAWVGEIGLDFYDKTQTPQQRKRQIQVFSRQLEIAQTLRRRVIIHNLKAIAAAVKQTGFAQGGIVHAFSGSAEEARVLTKLGFKIGIGSLLLNPNARKIRETLKTLNDTDFVLETDSPFMLKNEINTPANIRQIAAIAAEIRGVAVEEIAEATERNVEMLLAAEKVV